MAEKPRPNTYEGDVPAAEGERLAASDIINNTANAHTLRIIGALQPGHIVLDVGAGENTAVHDHVRSHEGAVYIGQDIRPSAVEAQLRPDDPLSVSMVADIRKGLMLPDESLDVVHARYVLAFFDGATRARTIAEMYRALRPGGRLVLTDYNWRAVEGNDDVVALRELGLSIDLFKADYGAVAADEIREVVGEEAALATDTLAFPALTDYSPLLSLGPVITNGLKAEENGEILSQNAAALFERLAAEAAQEDPQPYRWPDAVSVIVTKPEHSA